MMKSTVRTIILVAASVFAAVSCQKEAAVSEPQNPVNAGETIQVNINASLGDLVAADGTKATAESVIRLKWVAGDKVQAYCGTTKISIDEGLTVTPSENGMFAKLSGEITTTSLTSDTSVITFVYCSGCTGATDGLTFDFSNQTTTNGIPFVAYATLEYDGTATLTDKMVEFKFATSVMKIAATNLGGGEISNATISGINTKVTLAPSGSGEPAITGGKETPAKNISTNIFAASSDKTRAIITVGLVPDENKGRNIAISQSSFTNKGVITSEVIESNTSYTTPTSLFTCGTLGTGAGAHAYVLISGTKWATQNVGATEVTGLNSYGKYFAWGDVTGQSPSNNGTFTTGFSWSNCPFAATDDPTFSKYVTEAKKSTYGKDGTFFDERITLELANDAANKNWGGTWRMPTSAEFLALTKATFWKWDDTDKGYYVYAPQSGDAGKKDSDSGVTGTYNKSDALLFFPAAGNGYNTSLIGAGSGGGYWSSSLETNGDSSPYSAYKLGFYSGGVNLPTIDRYFGYSVRPVSD